MENIPNREEINQYNFREKLGISYVQKEYHLSTGRIAAELQKKKEQAVTFKPKGKLPEIVPNIIENPGQTAPLPAVVETRPTSTEAPPAVIETQPATSLPQLPEMAQEKPQNEELEQPEFSGEDENWSVIISDDEPISEPESVNTGEGKEALPEIVNTGKRKEIEPEIAIPGPPRKLLSINSGRFNIRVELQANGDKCIVIT